MSKEQDGGPAFPSPMQDDRACYARSKSGYGGLSIRDWLAGQIVSGLVVGCAGMMAGGPSAYAKGECNAVLSARAYALADAMLEAR